MNSYAYKGVACYIYIYMHGHWPYLVVIGYPGESVTKERRLYTFIYINAYTIIHIYIQLGRTCLNTNLVSSAYLIYTHRRPHGIWSSIYVQGYTISNDLSEGGMCSTMEFTINNCSGIFNLLDDREKALFYR